MKGDWRMNKKLEVIQEECSDCGICCLASIIKYYGGNVSLENLRYFTETNNYGTNAYELIICAKRFGLDGYGEKVKKIDDINFPAIAHLKLENDFYHFIVIYKIKNDFVYVMDPSYGNKKMKLEEFYNIFTGNILKFNQVQEIPKYNKSNFIKKSLIEEIKTNQNIFSLLFLISLMILFFTMINNLEIQILSKNNKYIFLLLSFVIVNNFLIYFKSILISNLVIKFNNNLLNKFVIHIFKLPLNYLKLKQKGEISTRFNELNDISSNFINLLFDINFNIILIIFTIILFIIISFNLLYFIIIFTTIYLVFNIKVYKKIVNEVRYSINLEENYNSKIIDYISNFVTIKHLGIYNYFTSNINSNLEIKNKVSFILNKKIYLFNMINNILVSFLLLFIFLYLLNNNYELSKSLVIFTLINFYINSIKTIIDYYPMIIIFKAYINKNNEFLSLKIDNKLSHISTFKKIIIKNLSYKINNQNIINNIDYEIFDKDRIFVSGPSGVGKSTLMKILNNEIQKYEGNVLLDNEDTRNFDLTNLITYVSQDETLFDDTLYNNLCLGIDIDSETLDRVIKVCRLDKLKIDMNSNIVNNSMLSGGERNRIILARSLLHSKNIIILDEVLKEVDYKLEIEIVRDILSFYSDKTIIYISHKNVGYLFDKVLTFRKEKDYGVRK